MQASICRGGRDAGRAAPARGSARRAATAPTLPEPAPERAASGSGQEVRLRRRTARLEHALFVLTLGSVAYVWLGSLLAEAARGL